MAIQTSHLSYRGTIGNLTYYIKNEKQFVRPKSSLTRESYFANKKNTLSKKSNKEFTEAATSGTFFRNAIKSLLLNSSDSYMHSRLLKELLSIIRTDTKSKLGERQVQKGNCTLLKGFEFNNKCTMDQLFFAPYNTTINRKKGTLTFNVPSFKRSQMMKTPPSATHFKINTVCIETDFKNKPKTDFLYSDFIPCNKQPVSINNVHSFTKGSKLPLFLVMSLEFYQEVNGEMSRIAKKEYNPRTIIEADMA